MKFFSVLCVVIVAALLENAFADPDPKSSSKETINKDVQPEDAIDMILYDGSGKTTVYPMRTLSRMLQNPQFNKDRASVVYFHCMDQTNLEQNVARYVETFNRQQKYNVLVFDWSYFIGGSSNTKNLADMQMLGETSARYFMELIQAGYMDNLFYFVGLGVGANMAGSLSRELNKASQQRYRIGRITALDPFIPSNYIYGNFQQVNKNDALFVDMIHTDVGSTDYTGKVDFYPNGGKTQPGCKRSSSKSRDLNSNECSHNRALEYYLESVNNPTSFLSTKCRTWSDFRNKRCGLSADGNMGLSAQPRLTGTYFLKTNDKSPYSKNTKSNQNSSKSLDSSSSSSSSSEESNESRTSTRNNSNQKNTNGSNESKRNNQVRQNMERNMSGNRSSEKNQNNQNMGSNERNNQNQRGNSNERNNQNQRSNSNERNNQDQWKNQAGRTNQNQRSNSNENKNQGTRNQGSNERNNQNQRSNSNERNNQGQWNQNQGGRSNERNNQGQWNQNQGGRSNERNNQGQWNQNQRGNDRGLFPDYSRFRNNNNQNDERSNNQQRDYFRN